MTLGGDKKKIIAYLAVLGPLAFYSVYTNFLAGPDTPAASKSAPRAAAVTPPSMIPSPGPPSAPRGTVSRGSREEFRPALHSKRPNEAAIDPARIDPTLRLDLLAKVQAVDLAGGARNLFQFGAAPAPKVDPIKGPEPKVVKAFVGPHPPPPPAPPAPTPPPPPPPPIPLKFYGYSTARDNGKRTAYLLHNEDIILASEGETVERRYRVVRINATSIVMEDTEVKKQQTLPLVEEAQAE